MERVNEMGRRPFDLQVCPMIHSIVIGDVPERISRLCYPGVGSWRSLTLQVKTFRAMTRKDALRSACHANHTRSVDLCSRAMSATLTP